MEVRIPCKRGLDIASAAYERIIQAKIASSNLIFTILENPSPFLDILPSPYLK